MIADFKAIREAEEHRPIEDPSGRNDRRHRVARNIPFQHERIELEREAGRILRLVE